MNDILLVVDVQNGFVNEKTRPILPNIIKLIQAFQLQDKKVVFTRFINRENSEYDRFIHWHKLKSSPEIDIVTELQEYATVVFDKTHYTPFIDEFEIFLKENSVERVFICGIATDSCVMKSAIDCFEHGYEPIVISDAVYSHAGEEAHKAGLLVISRNIGSSQIQQTESILPANGIKKAKSWWPFRS